MISLIKKNFWRVLLVMLSIQMEICISKQENFSNYNWSLCDLDFAKETILENHPGVYNNLDPSFCAHLNVCYNDARIRLNNIQDDKVCKQILHEFAKSFNDVHLRMWFSQETSSGATQIQQPIIRPQFSCDVTHYVCYVRIPTFAPNKEEIESVKNIIKTIDAIRQIPYIVFDVRGNGGGSSIWAKQIIDALFGIGYTHHKRAQTLANQYVEWRASISNIEYLKTVVTDSVHKNFGKESEESKWVESIVDGMQKAYDIGNKLYYDASNKFHDIANITPQGSLCTSTIIIVTDSQCVSACLDFIDELKLMATRVVLIGKQTSADSLYMECRSIALPSGKGRIVIPIKVYRNRPRDHNIPYAPDIEYMQDINDMGAVKNFVFDVIENMEKIY